MRLLLRAMVIAASVAALGFAPVVRAETAGPTAAAAAPSGHPSGGDGGPRLSGGTAATAGGASGKPSNPDRPGRRKDDAAGVRRDSAKDAQPPRAANAPRSTAKAVRRDKPINPELPLAQAPGFEMRADGTSVVTLLLSRPTEITRVARSRKPGKTRIWEFQLAQVQVGVRNNTNPLVTAHFQTPLTRTVLRRSGKGAILRLEFREDVEVTHLTKSGPVGTMLLEVEIPKATKTFSPPVTTNPASNGGAETVGELRLREGTSGGAAAAPNSGATR